MLLEINVKDKRDILRYCSILKSGKYSGCSITSKNNNYSLANTLCALVKINSTSVIPTFSCKANYDQSFYATYNNFLTFINSLKNFNIDQILLVSGNPSMKLNTIEVLKQFGNPNIKVAVAYNPYSKDLDNENLRIGEKLLYSNVNQVWLQLGQDLDKLKTAVEFIRQINPNIVIVNSVLEPTTKLLKSLQFRPWSGVYYTDEFYNSLDFALQNVRYMQELSKELGLIILISGV
jgi:hypothetical protein